MLVLGRQKSGRIRVPRNLVAIVLIRSLSILAVSLVFAPAIATAQRNEPAPQEEAQPTLMRMLAKHGLHDLDNERWNLYGQYTYISNWKPAFSAPYTNLNGSINSLLPGRDRKSTRLNSSH